jgi:hypothetical protein
MITSQVRDIQRRYYYIPNNPEDPVFYFFVGHIPHSRKKYSRGYDVNVIIHIYLIVKILYMLKTTKL